MADLEGRRWDASAGNNRARSKNLPFNVSRLCRSIALCWCRFSAVLTRFRGLLLALPVVDVLVVVVVVVALTGTGGEGRGWSAAAELVGLENGEKLDMSREFFARFLSEDIFFQWVIQ